MEEQKDEELNCVDVEAHIEAEQVGKVIVEEQLVEVLVPEELEKVTELEEEENDLQRAELFSEAVSYSSIAELSHLFLFSHHTKEENEYDTHEEKHEQIDPPHELKRRAAVSFALFPFLKSQ